MRNWETHHTEEREGFTIKLAMADEEDSPRGHFDSGDAEADQDTFDKIASGVYLWFIARVTVEKAGIVLGTAYLGGCCYASVEDFMTPDGYMPNMISEAMTEARATLDTLAPANALAPSPI